MRDPGEEIRRDQLDSGIRVVTDRMSGVGSVSIGCWVTIGSRDEPAELAGASHFLEHLLFKGTADRTARMIAEEVDARGGEMNAFTAQERTAYYLRVPADAFDWAVSLLGEVVARPAFRPDELEAERQVILEEILMNLDAPDDRAQTLLFEGLFPGHPVGREILGEAATVLAMGRDWVDEFHHAHYGPGNLIVAAAGAIDHDELLGAVDRWPEDDRRAESPTRSAPEALPVPLVVEERPTEQAHVCFGWRGLDHFDPDRYALAVGNQVFGGGAASRLFQKVREERGLAYAVGSSPASFADCGALTLYAGTAPNNLDELLAVVVDVVAELAEEGVNASELEVAKGFLCGSFVLGLEDSGSRMSRIGAGEAIRREVIPIAEHLRRIEAVDLDDVRRVLHQVLSGPRTVTAVGPFGADHPALARLS